ncbi:MAG: homoserine kinase [Rhodothermales bacterium]|nr:homoserine kinase [Rhodothermales bacterium]
MNKERSSSVTVWGPASLSNIGPGFDTLGLAIEGFGDRIRAVLRNDDLQEVVVAPVLPVDYPLDPAANTAAVAAKWVLSRSNVRKSLTLEITKGIPLGSGIGGSAASAAAGAVAANVLLGEPFDKNDLVNAALEGERVASGVEHGDNVLPALFGGLCLVSPDNPRSFQRMHVASGLSIAVIIPDLQIMTSSARMILPSSVDHRDAVVNGANLAFLVTAFGSGDWSMVGEKIMTDKLAEPYRARLLHGYDHIKQAALSAGALGAALSGSGPAMFAVSDDNEIASHVLVAMANACKESGMDSIGRVVGVDRDGTRVLDA